MRTESAGDRTTTHLISKWSAQSAVSEIYELLISGFFYFYVFMIETCFEVSLSCKAGIFTKWTEVQWVVLQHHRGGYEALSHEAHVWHPCSIFSAFTSQQSNHSDFESAPAAHQLTPPSPVSCFPWWLAHWQLATLLLWWSLVSFHFHPPIHDGWQ